jgi:hypothetical protein
MASLKFKRSAVAAKVPVVGDLDLGELAINTYDGKVYIKKDNGTASIVEIGSGSGTVTSVAASGGTTGLTFTGSPITTSGTLTLGGTLAVANGGTGATDAPTARANLSAAVLGANGDITSLTGITGGISSPDFVQFDTTATVTSATGRLYFNDGEGGLSYTLKGGNVVQEVGQSQQVLVYNGTGVTLTKGQVVYSNGAQGQRPTVALALATSDATSARTLGIVAESIANGAEGWVTSLGILENIDTSAFTAGAQLYLSGATAGELTATKTYAPIHMVYVARCIKSHATSGRLFVTVQNGYEMDELHDVSAQSPSNGQTIVYNSSTSLWEKNTVSLTAGVNGTLPVANGGTGAATLTGYVKGSGTTAMTALATIPVADITGTLPVSKGGTGATTLTANSVILGNGTSAVQFVAPSTSGNVLTSNGTTWTSATPAASLAGQTNTATPFETSLGHQAGNVNTGVNNTFIGYQAGLANNTGTDNVAIGYQALLVNTTGTSLLAVGSGALDANTGGSSNIAVGRNALGANNNGNSNIAIGVSALLVNTTGTDNIAVGTLSLDANTTGTNNVAMGRNALGANTTATGNTAIGHSALAVNTTGSGLVAIGSGALDANTTGTNNVAVGVDALGANTTGGTNVAVGARALDANTNGGSNVAVGLDALGSNTTGNNNTALGESALGAATTAGNNTAIGRGALQLNTTGTSNTAVGYVTLQNNSFGNSNTALGNSALLANTTGGGNVAVGANALDANTTGQNNVAMGSNALGANTTASSNTAIGYNALLVNTTGSSLVAVGSGALDANTTGTSNIAVGSDALGANTTGTNNVAMGRDTLGASTTATGNTAIGHSALVVNTTGGDLVAVGSTALFSNTTGAGNTAVGASTLFTNTIGTNNTALGAYALNGNTTGTDNVAVGYFSGISITTGTQNTLLGTSAGSSGTNDLTTGSNNTIIGYNAASSTATISNEITLGNSSIATLRCQVTTITALSDARDKTNIDDLDAGLSFIKALRPVRFDWAMRDGGKVGEEDTGFIAQDLQAAMAETGIDIPGLVYENNPDRLEAGYGKLLPIMVKAIQELSAEVADLKAQIKGV